MISEAKLTPQQKEFLRDFADLMRGNPDCFFSGNLHHVDMNSPTFKSFGVLVRYNKSNWRQKNYNPENSLYPRLIVFYH